ncbi:hypothetical protein E2320_012159, partial [Naja naja]
MFRQRKDVFQRKSSEKVIHRGEASDWRIPRQMGSLGPKAMITGGAGYSGFYLSRVLLQEGIGVVLLDRLEDGDETLPYYPLEKQPDNYSKSKTIAEQMILAANGAPLQGRRGDAANKIIQSYLLYITFDTTGTWTNWVHINNLTQAYLLARRALTAERNFIAVRSPFLILCWYEKLGHPKPRLVLPGYFLKII